MGKGYEICEIFTSVQGEGEYVGKVATFIRFAGCNLRCSWCDTKKSWESGKKYTEEELIQEIPTHINLIVFTGGEPTLYDLTPLIQALREKNPNLIASIETNGTNPVPKEIDWTTCSPKPDADYKINCTPNELKYVVDNTFSIDVIPEKYFGKISIWLQPNGFDLENSMKRCYELVMENSFLRLGFQLHKIYDIE